MARSKEEEEQIRKILQHNKEAQRASPVDPSCSSFDEFELSLDKLTTTRAGVKKHSTPNVFEGIEFFKAVVALPFPISTGPQACKAIVPGLHSCVSNPFLEDSSDASAQIIGKLPTFVSPYQLFSPLVPGSVIEVSFDNPWFYWGTGTILKVLQGRPLAMPEWAKDVPGALELFADPSNWIPNTLSMVGDFLNRGLLVIGKPIDPALLPACNGRTIDTKRFMQYGNLAKNNWRSGQPTLADLKCIIEQKGIKRIVRMNGDEGGTTMAQEKGLADSMGVDWQFINAHQGYATGKGYVKSKSLIHPILDEGNTLVHCTAGKDRTGYIVASYLKEYEGETDLEGLYVGTNNESGWSREFQKPLVIRDPDGKAVDGAMGFAKYLDGFYPLNKWCADKPRGAPNVCNNLDRFGYK